MVTITTVRDLVSQRLVAQLTPEIVSEYSPFYIRDLYESDAGNNFERSKLVNLLPTQWGQRVAELLRASNPNFDELLMIRSAGRQVASDEVKMKEMAIVPGLWGLRKVQLVKEHCPELFRFLRPAVCQRPAAYPESLRCMMAELFPEIVERLLPTAPPSDENIIEKMQQDLEIEEP